MTQSSLGGEGEYIQKPPLGHLQIYFSIETKFDSTLCGNFSAITVKDTNVELEDKLSIIQYIIFSMTLTV